MVNKFIVKIIDPRAIKILQGLEELGLISMKKIETEGEADETLPANAMNDEEFDIYANRLLSIALGPN